VAIEGNIWGWMAGTVWGRGSTGRLSRWAWEPTARSTSNTDCHQGNLTKQIQPQRSQASRAECAIPPSKTERGLWELGKSTLSYHGERRKVKCGVIRNHWDQFTILKDRK
jgi:hypothetical protein